MDRQKSNTKDRDPHGLVNEGFRYRDVETGTFLTRDPLGFVDGPNVYTYVVQNPWTKFDPLGLFVGDGSSQSMSFWAQMENLFGWGQDDAAREWRNAERVYTESYLEILPVTGVPKNVTELVTGKELILRDPLTEEKIPASRMESAMSIGLELLPGAFEKVGTLNRTNRLLGKTSIVVENASMGKNIPGGLPEGFRVVDSGPSYYIMENANGMKIVRFKASEAVSTGGVKKGGYSGTPETEAYVNPDTGLVYVSEGKHRLTSVAVDGDTVADSVPGAKGWLDYDYMGTTTRTDGVKPQWEGDAVNPSNPDNPWEGAEGYD